MLPLANVRVLDLSNVLAGPFCGYNLVRMGAEVIKVEKPDGGDLARALGADPHMATHFMGLSFVAVNAGKQSVTLDLKSQEGRDIFLRLASMSDVVLENFRPGVMRRLGLSYETLSGLNPKLIYCAISGFGQDGPWSERPAYDQIVQGLSGVMSVTGDASSAPLRTGFPISDTLAGLTASFAISAALVNQRQTGRGCFIDVSLLESTLAAMGWVVSNYLNADLDPHPNGNENLTASPSGTFQTASGPLNIAANEQKQFEALCDLIGRSELKVDPDFSDRHARKKNRNSLNTHINEALASRPAEQWELLMNNAGIPAGCVLTVPEVLAQPQVTGRAFVETLDMSGKDGRRLRVTRPGFTFDHPFPPVPSPPALGQDTEKWLTALGLTPGEIDRLAEKGVIGGSRKSAA